MLHVTFAGWAATIGLIVALFVLDLFISRPGHAHEVGFREAVSASVFYIAAALAFGVAFGLIAGWEFGTEYFAGYIVEKSLSVDNLFVFVVIMTTFAVPAQHQQRVLTFGILVALVMRAIFIALGAVLVSAFSFAPRVEAPTRADASVVSPEPVGGWGFSTGSVGGCRRPYGDPRHARG